VCRATQHLSSAAIDRATNAMETALAAMNGMIRFRDSHSNTADAEHKINDDDHNNDGQ
jgi:hypothetical protein